MADAPTFDVSTLDALEVMMLDKANAIGEKLSSHVATVNAAANDSVALLAHQLRPNHPRYAEWQALNDQILELESLMDSENLADATLPSEDDVKAAETAITALREQGAKYVEFLVKAQGDAIRTAISPHLFAASGNGAGKGAPKPRLSHATVTHYKDGNELVETFDANDGVRKATFTNLSTFVKGLGEKVENGQLQAAYFAAAGVTDIKAAPAVVEFAIGKVIVKVAKK